MDRELVYLFFLSGEQDLMKIPVPALSRKKIRITFRYFDFEYRKYTLDDDKQIREPSQLLEVPPF
jgi:hypothetical protein